MLLADSFHTFRCFSKRPAAIARTGVSALRALVNGERAAVAARPDPLAVNCALMTPRAHRRVRVSE